MGREVDVSPKSILTGKEAVKTNKLLQEIGVATKIAEGEPARQKLKKKTRKKRKKRTKNNGPSFSANDGAFEAATVEVNNSTANLVLLFLITIPTFFDTLQRRSGGGLRQRERSVHHLYCLGAPHLALQV